MAHEAGLPFAPRELHEPSYGVTAKAQSCMMPSTPRLIMTSTPRLCAIRTPCVKWSYICPHQGTAEPDCHISSTAHTMDTADSSADTASSGYMTDMDASRGGNSVIWCYVRLQGVVSRCRPALHHLGLRGNSKVHFASMRSLRTLVLHAP